jgi:6-pyruvoyl-tetrahydropterin synthase
MKTAEEKFVAHGQITISKSFDFSASHELWLLPETHKQHGFVTDFGNLAPFGNYLKTTFDHRRINQVLELRDVACRHPWPVNVIRVSRRRALAARRADDLVPGRSPARQRSGRHP